MRKLLLVARPPPQDGKSPKVSFELSESFQNRHIPSMMYNTGFYIPVLNVNIGFLSAKILLCWNMNSLLPQPRWSFLSVHPLRGQMSDPDNNGSGQKQSWYYQGIHPPTPATNPPWYLLHESAPLIISLSHVLVLPKGVPLKALKGFEGYMVTESVSYLKDLYLALCQCLRREKNTQYTCIYKNWRKAAFSPLQPDLKQIMQY